MSREKRKPITAQEQLEMDIMAETELSRLQRQYRIMDGDRKAFEEESTAQLKRQKRLLSLLRKENQNLLEDAQIATSKANKRKDMQFLAEIQKLLEDNDKYKEAVRKQKSDLKEIEYQIRKVEDDVQIYKRQEGKANGEIQRRILKGQRTVEALENKLDHCIKRFCTILTENQTLRQEIDHLLRERNIYNKICETHFKRMNTCKKIMIDLIEQATLAYDQREECGEKLQALRHRAHNDNLLHMSDMRELIRQLDRGTNLQDFLSVKGQRRIMKDLERKEQQKRQQTRECLEKELQHYKETLAKVKELAQEDDLSKLSAEFIKQEEENFALFNYVNELNYELETLADNISKLHDSIDEQKDVNEKRAEQQKDTIESLKAELKAVENEAKNKKDSLEKKENELKQLLTGIGHLFKIVRCDDTPLLNLLGQTGQINNYNVLVYLGILENRVTELVQIANYKDKVIQKSLTVKVPKTICSKKSELLPPLPISPCSLCAEEMLTDANITHVQAPKTIEKIKEEIHEAKDEYGLLHNMEKCALVNLIPHKRARK